MNLNFIAPITLSMLSVACFVCVGVIAIVLNTSTYKIGKEATQLIEQCEATLPRNQVWVLKAEPKE